MRILAISDAHGFVNPIYSAIEKSKPDYFIYLGDGSEKVEELSFMYDNIRFYIVGGNCDFGSTYKTQNEIKVGGKTIFFTHGHLYGVKHGYEKIISAAKNRNADIVLFGHTHNALSSYDDGLYIVNPGSISSPNSGKPSYAVIDIVNEQIAVNIVKC